MTNPTPHGQVPEALQLADEISKAGAFPAYPRAPYEAAAAELRRLHAQVAALTAAPQGVAYAELPTHSHAGRVYEEGFLIGTCPLYTADQLHAFADATHTLRASHGQAPAEPESISREDWIEHAVRVYLIAGDTYEQAQECAAYLWGELDMDDLADPYDAAMSDIEGRGMQRKETQ